MPPCERVRKRIQEEYEDEKDEKCQGISRESTQNWLKEAEEKNLLVLEFVCGARSDQVLIRVDGPLGR